MSTLLHQPFVVTLGAWVVNAMGFDVNTTLHTGWIVTGTHSRYYRRYRIDFKR